MRMFSKMCPASISLGVVVLFFAPLSRQAMPSGHSGAVQTEISDLLQ